MNSERADSYGRVMRVLRDDGPARLHGDEQGLIREAADALLFTEEIDQIADERLAEVITLGEELVECGRWTETAFNHLIDDLAACGPGPAPVAV